MNKWIKRVVPTLLVAAQFLVIPTVSAGSLEDIQNKKETVKVELNQVQKELNQKLTEASNITATLDELAEEIKKEEIVIEQTEEEIIEQEDVVEKRYEHTAEQLKAMQKSEVNHNIVLGLFQAESLSDFINRLYAASVLTSANEGYLNEANLEYEKLNNLKEELVVVKEELDIKKSETLQQKAILDETLASLKATLTNNQKKLNQLSAEEAEIEAEIKARAEAEAAEAAAAAKVKAAEVAEVKKEESSQPAKSVKTTSNESKSVSSSEEKVVSSNESAPAETNTGSWMNFQSTGYSTQQPGLSTHTATGINLLVNPRVIAVDPSQIPLGSLVEVQGMGVYVAGDTGGAIKGRIIDVHFPTVGEALSWGRRSVNIRIIN